MNATQMNRRSFALGSAAALAGTVLFTGHTLAKISESHTSFDGFVDVEWDPDLWQVDGEGYETGALLRDLEYERYGDDCYYLQILSRKPEFGDASPEDAIELHMADWFSQGMLTSRIVDRWVTDTSFGYLFTSGQPESRTFIIFDYRQVPDKPGHWVEVSFVLDQVLFDEETTAAMLNGASVNGKQLISDRTTDELIVLFEEHFG